jgi:hypothetical protein
MQVTLLLPGLLLPHELAGDLVRSMTASALTKRLAGARQVGQHSAAGFALRAAHLDWIAREVFGLHEAPPSAPYAYTELSKTAPRDAQLWHADPVHIELGRDHLFVEPLASLPDAADAEILIEVANELLSGCGAQLQRADAHWFLLTERAWALSAMPLAAAAHQRLDTVLPAGADSPLWMRAHNEVQMSWHEHPVNEARESRGEAAINGLWLHGGGRWQPLAPLAYTRVNASDPALRGAALAAGATVSASVTERPADRALVVWDDAFGPYQREDWGAWLRAVAELGQRVATLAAASVIDLVLTGRTTIRTLRSQRADVLRFWQRTDLASMLAEPQ